jgi:AcrR family transcriptional regulator
VNRDDIVVAAARVFRRHGYRGASLNDIAEVVGIQKASLYHHIDSKEELLLLVLEKVLHAGLEKIGPIAESDLAPCDKLERAVYQHIIVTAREMDSHAVFLQDVDSISSELSRRAYVRTRRRYEAAFRDIVGACLAANGRSDDERLVVLAILGMCNYLSRWYRPDGPASPEEVAGQFSRLAKRMVGCG